MRRLFTTDEARQRGVTSDALRWGATKGRWRRVERGVYAVGPEPPSELDRARGRVLASEGVAGGRLAGVLHGLDGVSLGGRPTTRRRLGESNVVVIQGTRTADGLHTLIDLAATMTDDGWEQALESAVRKGLVTIDGLVDALGEFRRSRTSGAPRIRRVLDRRPSGAPPTESLLETLMVQLARGIRDLADPTRQLGVFDEDAAFVARVDLAWPDLGLFVELDGQQHADQPVYDARRETAVVAATGWLCGRFTWQEVVHLPTTTARNLERLVGQARRRGRAA